jgi:guanosine-3',5'-bis(diphosphate) 3'-pyrophosphohydrolase
MQRFQAASEQGTGLFHIALRVRDRSHLIDLMNGLRKVRGVFTVERVKGSIFGKVQ